MAARRRPGIVPLPDALVEPLAVVVEHVHALVADRAVFGTLEIVKMTIHASLIFQGFIYRDVLGYNDTVDTVNSNYSDTFYAPNLAFYGG